MNKWQKVINQIAKDDEGFMDLSYRQRKSSLKKAISKENDFNFDKLKDFKNWNKNRNIMMKSFMDNL